MSKKFYDLNKLIEYYGIDKSNLFFIAPKDYGKNQYERTKLKRAYEKYKKGV